MIVIIDNGHGGLDPDGKPYTPGKRSPFDDHGQLIEGVSARTIARLVSKALAIMGHKVHLLVPEEEDISLKERGSRIQKFANTEAIFISIHHDAFTNDKANGFSVWTTKAETNGDKLASALYEEAKAILVPEGMKIREDFGDGDSDFEAGFAVCNYAEKSGTPAALIELGFMTNYDDYKFIQSSRGKQLFASVIVNAIVRIIRKGWDAIEVDENLPRFTGKYKKRTRVKK
jgi:N-acetylmuramoyl-L-alanine amidase